MSMLLEVSGVTVTFDGFRAINNLSINFAKAELRAIIGPNGAGKTTFMDIVTGKTKPDEGTVMPISFDSVSFAYPGAQAGVRGIDLVVEDGELLALIGPSGSGKSTCLKLLAGFFNPDSGTIKVDGQDVNFVSGVVMRSWVPGFISAIPLVGMLFWLIDPLVIFGEERRCVHDVMAGTKVISV